MDTFGCKESHVWKLSLDEKPENCPLLPRPIIYLSGPTHGKIQFLMRKVGTEWLAYLKGKWISENQAYIYNLIIPKQEAYPSYIDEVEYPQDKHIVGTVHSHSNMGTFWSGPDNSTLRSNHDINIVVSKDKPYLATIRYKAPCGSFSLQEVRLIAEPYTLRRGNNPYNLPLQNIRKGRVPITVRLNPLAALEEDLSLIGY